MITAFKATRSSGRDFYSGKFHHEVGAVLAPGWRSAASIVPCPGRPASSGTVGGAIDAAKSSSYAAAAAADADDADADADDADADADADDDAFYRLWPDWVRWYVRPRWALWRAARWQLFMGTAPNPWAPIVEMYKLGVAPIGYDATGEFCIYVPEVRS